MQHKIGDKIDKLEILQEKQIKGKETRYVVRCDCGEVFEINVGNLFRKSRKIKQCKECALKMLSQLRRKTNNYELNGNVAECYTAKGELFIIDSDDIWLLENYYWRLDQKGYCVADERNCKDSHKVKMHQLIAKNKYGEYDKNLFVPDHLNRIKHDNRKKNIELKTHAENSQNIPVSKTNKTGTSGVTQRENGKYLVRIGVCGKRIYIGTFDSLEEASNARKEAESIYWLKRHD